jgi:hypothetical protein
VLPIDTPVGVTRLVRLCCRQCGRHQFAAIATGLWVDREILTGINLLHWKWPDCNAVVGFYVLTTAIALERQRTCTLHLGTSADSSRLFDDTQISPHATPTNRRGMLSALCSNYMCKRSRSSPTSNWHPWTQCCARDRHPRHLERKGSRTSTVNRVPKYLHFTV